MWVDKEIKRKWRYLHKLHWNKFGKPGIWSFKYNCIKSFRSNKLIYYTIFIKNTNII